MLLWLIILISLGFAWMGFKKGAYVMFATLFNFMFAIFISVLSTPVVLILSPGFERHGYYAAGAIVVMFLLVFALLQTFAWYFFLRDREEYFPVLFDRVFSVLLGFLCGYVLCSVLILAVCVTPFSEKIKVDWLCTRDSMQKLAVPGVRYVCNFLAEYSLECFNGESEEVVDFLMTINEPVEEDSGMPVLLPGDSKPQKPLEQNIQSAPAEDTSEAPVKTADPENPQDTK